MVREESLDHDHHDRARRTHHNGRRPNRGIVQGQTHEPGRPAQTNSANAQSEVAPEPSHHAVPDCAHQEPSDRVEGRIPSDFAPGQAQFRLQIGKDRAKTIEDEAEQAQARVGEKRCPVSSKGHDGSDS